MSLSSPDQPASSHAAPSTRWGLPFVLSAVMLFIYAGFILLVAFDKPLLGRVIVPGLSVGILLGALVIISAWLLTLIYVVQSNRAADRSSSAAASTQEKL